MKKLRITMNEKVYEVTVEVLEDDEVHYPGAGPHEVPPTPALRSLASKVTPPAPAAPAPPVRKPKTASSGNLVLAPIVGTVNRILVKPNDSIEANQPLIVLDAMKMDTFINAPCSGVVKAIDCNIGDSVQVGQKLATIE